MKLLSLLLPASDSQRSPSCSPLDCFPHKHKLVIRNLSIQPSGAKGLSPGLDLSSCQHPGCWLANIFLNAGPACQAPEAESWSLLRCCCRLRMSYQGLEPLPRRVHGIWTLADLATWAARRGDSWHCYPHADHTGVVMSDAVPGGRQSGSEMTPEEQENSLTYFLPFLFLQLGDAWDILWYSQRGRLNCYLHSGW